MNSQSWANFGGEHCSDVQMSFTQPSSHNHPCLSFGRVVQGWVSGSAVKLGLVEPWLNLGMTA